MEQKEGVKEFILCAAIHFNDGKKHLNQPDGIGSGFVIVGRRHHDCYNSLSSIGHSLGVNEKELVKNHIEKIGRDNQGFITSTNRYVSRSKAFKIARSNNQIINNAHDGKGDGILISEDLY